MRFVRMACGLYSQVDGWFGRRLVICEMTECLRSGVKCCKVSYSARSDLGLK